MAPIYLILLIAAVTFGFPQDYFNNSGRNGGVRNKRQATGGFICVPPGTCINSTQPTPTPSPPVVVGIDPRIITPGASTLAPVPTVAPTPAPTAAPTSCPAGLVPCYPASMPPLCGQRLVSNINTAPGPTTFGAFPWQAYIKNETMFTGSGALLDSSTVITVAHKIVRNLATPSNIQVYMGVYDPATSLTTAQMRTASQLIINPNANYSTPILSFKDDLAIIKLSSPFNLGYQTTVGTACLPPAGSSYIGNSNCVVAGWGQSAHLKFDAPVAQKQAPVTPVTYATCRASYANILTDVDYFLDPVGQLCAGGVDSIDSCQQDGGAPLVCPDATTGRFNVVGLVNWGKGCGRPGVYGVYMDVSKYLPWIQQYVTPNAG